MKQVLGLLSFVLLVTAVLAASKCGKKSHKSKYGRPAEFKSLDGQKGQCKYRIRTVPGLHIKIVLDNYHPDPCCLEVTIMSRKKTKGGKAAAISIPAGPRVSLVVNSSFVDVVIKTSSSARAVSISHEAVIPSGGDFGFNFRASRKPKFIRSLNFPKTRLPSGVRSTWRVTSPGREPIRIEIVGLQTSGGNDYVEVFDGSTSVGRHSGSKNKRELPIVNFALSGNMVIVLQTETANSKGFKAKIVMQESGSQPTTEPVSVNGSDSGHLQCHKRLRILSSGVTVSDEHSRMTCSDDQICGRMVVEGSSSVGGNTLSISSETLHCIPRDLCIGTCGDIPPSDKSITVTSCALSCCSTDMCNSSPDGPDVPPSSGIERPSPSGTFPGRRSRLRCNERSEVTRGSGMGRSSASSGDSCPSDSVCALYVFSGVSDDASNEKVVGYVAKCTPEASCNDAACSDLYETRDVNLAWCNVTCCKENNCNDPDEVTIPTLPPPEPVARSCYSVKRLLIAGRDSRTDISLHSECSDPEDRCLRVDAYVTDGGDRNGVASFGKCVAQSACNSLDCEALLGLESSVTVLSCRADCCSNDLCNERPLMIPAPTGVTTGLYCHNTAATIQEGSVSLSRGPTYQENALCIHGEVCALFKFYGTSTESHQIGEPMAGYTATCQPAASCNNNACQTLSAARNIAVTSCEATCCNTNMCNEPGEPPMPSPRTPAAGFVNQCYAILQSSVHGTSSMNSQSVSTCGAESACVRVEATTEASGVEVDVVYGACVPKAMCALINCDSIAGAMPGMTLENCLPRCCDTELCNDQPLSGPSATLPTVSVATSPTPPLPSGFVNQCYDILQLKVQGTYSMNRQSASTCGADSVCVRVQATKEAYAVEFDLVYGTCIPKAKCAHLTCDVIANTVPGVTFENCLPRCCDTELCNDQPLSGPSATLPTVSVVTSPTPPLPGSVNQCYSILRSSAGSMNLGNQVSAMTCGSDSACVRVEADGTTTALHGDVRVSMVYGTCYPKIACSNPTCDALTGAVPGMTFQHCRVQCCYTELCNGDLPLSTTSIASSTAPPFPESAGDSGGASGSSRCYDMLDLKVYGSMTLPGNRKRQIDCQPDSQCVKISVIAVHPSYPQVKIRGIVGNCALKTRCASSCSALPTTAVMDGVVIEDCDVHCCNGDLCNE